MRVLFFVPPWPTQGDLFFSRNAFRRHLLLQANALAGQGVSVTIVVGDNLRSDLKGRDARIDAVVLDHREVPGVLGGWRDPSVELYREGPDASCCGEIAAWLRRKLPEHVDAILIWETPIPFFDLLYPDALQVHQMPGAFAREPYPHTVVFDPMGLYRRGSLFSLAPDLVEKRAAGSALVDQFRRRARRGFRKTPIPALTREAVDPERRFKRLHLLPLQVSGHYAFQADTGYADQLAFLLDVLGRVPKSEGVVATQYIARIISEIALDPDTKDFLSRRYPNFVHKADFDLFPAVSQYLLHECDDVITASSSIGIQAFLWKKPITVFGDTFLKPFASPDFRPDAFDGVLDFVLGRQQPLARLVTKDGPFLVSLIEDLIGRRHRDGIERLASLPAIREGYPDELVAAFRDPRLQPSGRRASAFWTGIPASEALGAALAGASVVSLDIFDTLIRRPVESPADMFAVLGERAERIAGRTLFDFGENRLWAEHTARERVSDDAEITLGDIYSTLNERFALPEDVLEKLIGEEIDLELALCEPRPAGHVLWGAVRKSGKPVVLATDMYLPEAAIRAMLAKCGYDAFEKIFVSSSIGRTKKSGALFDHMLTDMGLAPADLVHVGDNPDTDIGPAEERGIRTVRVPRSLDLIRRNTSYRSAFPMRSPIAPASRSMVVGAIAANLFGDTETSNEQDLFFGRRYNLGFAGLGPVVFAYASWIRRAAREDGIARLYFLSREGEIMQRVFAEMETVSPTGLAPRYLYGSRRAIRVASMRSSADVRDVASNPITAGASVADVLSARFGLRAPDLEDSLDTKQWEYLQSTVEAGQGARNRFTRFAVELTSPILDNAAEERAVYKEYLEDCGFDSPDPVALIDLGWNANMQGDLSRLIGRPTLGYYYATLYRARRWAEVGDRHRGFLADYVHEPHPSALVTNRPLAEFLLCASHGSVERMVRSDAGFRPVLRDELEPPSRKAFVDEVHDGIVDYARYLLRAWGETACDVAFDPYFCERVIGRYFSSPTRNDALIFAGQYYEDAFGGLPRRYFVSLGVEAAGDIGWPAGDKAVKRAPPPPNARAEPPFKTNRIDDEIRRDPRFKMMSSVLRFFQNDTLNKQMDLSPAEYVRGMRNGRLRFLAKRILDRLTSGEQATGSGNKGQTRG